jgi:hypothetical protein
MLLRVLMRLVDSTGHGGRSSGKKREGNQDRTKRVLMIISVWSAPGLVESRLFGMQGMAAAASKPTETLSAVAFPRLVTVAFGCAFEIPPLPEHGNATAAI